MATSTRPSRVPRITGGAVQAPTLSVLQFFLDDCARNVDDFLAVAAGHGWIFDTTHETAVKKLAPKFSDETVKFVESCVLQWREDNRLFPPLTPDAVIKAITAHSWTLHPAHYAPWKILKASITSTSVAALSEVSKVAGIDLDASRADELVCRVARRAYVQSLRAAMMPATGSAAPMPAKAPVALMPGKTGAAALLAPQPTFIDAALAIVAPLATTTAKQAPPSKLVKHVPQTAVAVPVAIPDRGNHGLQGYIKITYKELLARFGPPEIGPNVCRCVPDEDGDDECECLSNKVTCEWLVILDQYSVSIYDWMTASTPMEKYEWHIGGGTSKVVPVVRKHFAGYVVTCDKDIRRRDMGYGPLYTGKKRYRTEEEEEEIERYEAMLRSPLDDPK